MNSQALIDIIIAVGSVLGTLLTIVFIKSSVRCFGTHNDLSFKVFMDRLRKRSTDSELPV